MRPRYIKLTRMGLSPMTFVSTKLSVLCFLSVMTSCTHNDGDIGDLYGRWQLSRIQQDDTTAMPSDLFICFQSNVVQLSADDYATHTAIDVIGEFRHMGDSLIITSYLTDTNMVQNYQRIYHNRFCLGDYASSHRLHIDRLNRQSLDLSRGSDRWSFRRY